MKLSVVYVFTNNAPFVQANIRAKKREEFRQQLQEKSVEDISESHFFDPRISMRPNMRNKRSLRFHEPGKFQQMADRMRMKVIIEFVFIIYISGTNVSIFKLVEQSNLGQCYNCKKTSKVP